MGNSPSNGQYIQRQISQASGTDSDTLQVFHSPMAEEFRNKAFSQFDRHSNGTINFRDFLMVVHMTSNGSADDKLRTMFTLYDQDGNGAIDAEEMNSVIRDIYQMLGEDSHGQAKEMFALMDKDADGKITEQEFIRACLEDADLVRMLSTTA